MDKKFSLLALAAIVTFGMVTAAALTTNERDNNTLLGVRAAPKSFIFNGDVGTNQFPQSATDTVVERSVDTNGASSDLVTSVSLKERNSNVERVKTFGGDYFVKMAGETILAEPVFNIEIGVNNPTSVSVTFGLIKTHETTTTDRIGCDIKLYKNSERIGNISAASKDFVGKESTVDLTKSSSEVGNKVVIAVYASNFNIDPQDLFFIKSITLNWEC